MKCHKKIRFYQTPIYFYKYFDNGYSAVLHPKCANEEFNKRMKRDNEE